VECDTISSCLKCSRETLVVKESREEVVGANSGTMFLCMSGNSQEQTDHCHRESHRYYRSILTASLVSVRQEGLRRTNRERELFGRSG
jgi:hypothetical protein